MACYVTPAASSFAPRSRSGDVMRSLISGVVQTGRAEGWSVAVCALNNRDSSSLLLYVPPAGRCEVAGAMTQVARRMSVSESGLSASYGAAVPGDLIDLERRNADPRATIDQMLATSLGRVTAPPLIDPLPSYSAAQIAELARQCAAHPCPAPDVAAFHALCAAPPCGQ